MKPFAFDEEHLSSSMDTGTGQVVDRTVDHEMPIDGMSSEFVSIRIENDLGSKHKSHKVYFQ